MQPGTYSLERSLEDWINDAIKCAVKNPCAKDSFGSELNRAMGSFASCLPTCLQQDGITATEMLPSGRNVTVTSIPNKDQNKKPSHPLISEVTDGVIVLKQPLFYTVKEGDTLSDISWKVTGRKASVMDLKNWNTIWGDLIKPGQVLYLADPYDPFVKEVSSKLSKMELTGRNPKISLDRLSGEMVAHHGGLFEGEYQVEIILEYREPIEKLISSVIIETQEKQVSHWAPNGDIYGSGFNVNKRLGDQPFDYDQHQMKPDNPGWTDWLGIGLDASDDVLTKVGDSFNKYQAQSNANRWGLD